MAACLPCLLAQLTTGTIEGTLRGTDGLPVAHSPILITGGTGFSTLIHSSANGGFVATLPHGRYRLFGGVLRNGRSSGVTVLVVPLQTAHIDLVTDASETNGGVVWA